MAKDRKLPTYAAMKSLQEMAEKSLKHLQQVEPEVRAVERGIPIVRSLADEHLKLSERLTKSMKKLARLGARWDAKQDEASFHAFEEGMVEMFSISLQAMQHSAAIGAALGVIRDVKKQPAWKSMELTIKRVAARREKQH